MKMKKGKYLLLLLCVPLLVTGCKQVPKLDNGQEVVVELDGKQFTANEFFDELKDLYGTSVLVNLVDEFISEKSLSEDQLKEVETRAKSQYNTTKAYYGDGWEEALRNAGYLNGDQYLEQLQSNFKKSLALENYVKSDVLTEEEIQKYYDEDIYGEITVRHILIMPDTTEDMKDDEKKKAKEAALKEAKELIEQLNKSENLEEDFKKLAIEKSEDTGSAKEGGLIENFTNDSGLVEEFWEGSLKLEVGKMTKEPVETEYGYHIIYKVSQKEKPAKEDVLDKIKDNLVSEILSEDTAYDVYWAGLREKYNMTIHDDILKGNYDSAMSNIKK